MKTHIYTLLIVLLTVLSLPLSAEGTNESPNLAVEQAIQVVDINKADLDTLALLKGVGEKRAKAIIAYRELHGEFNALDDLLNVKGIGEQMLRLNKERIKL
ncbi:competence protein ComEA [Colwellia chukchiensis]|uniref:Competence protein ComEA n=1 Tax=Colwellia chukchiensis TaxID=641665 RepID=A0A1H7MIT2_9GAMM|nr:helix-hairpin-helix domain-containing protein [Colwellia chukchiensis]SEL10979.1 competence protein ComEA [Colwellia chukchiensis]